MTLTSIRQRPFSEWLADVMFDRKLKAADLTRESEGALSPAALSRWLNGKAHPRPEKFPVLAKALGMRTADIATAIATAPDRSKPAKIAEPDADADTVEVSFDGRTWGRAGDEAGVKIVAQRLEDIIRADEEPVLAAHSHESMVDAAERYRAAEARILSAQTERAQAIEGMLATNASPDDIAALLGISPAGLRHRMRAPIRPKYGHAWTLRERIGA